MAEEFDNDIWFKDIRGTPSTQALAEFLELWRVIRDAPALEDYFVWRFSANGQYSTSSAYSAVFLRSKEADYAKML